MPRLGSSQVAVKILDAENAAGVGSDTGEVLDADVIEEPTTALASVEPITLAPMVDHIPTEMEAILQYGTWQIPLNAEERRLYLIAQSGLYKSVRTLGRALALSEKAKEMRIGEHEAFEGIYDIKGTTCMSAHLIGALIKRSGKYDYRPLEMTSERCVLQWFEEGVEIGQSEFTIDQARANGWVREKSAWVTAPDEMCRNRALTKGARTYCPHVLRGILYTVDELVDINGGLS